MRRAIVIVATLALTACGTPQGVSPQADSTSTTSPADPPPGVTSTGNLGVIVPPDSEGKYPQDTMVSCGGSGPFPLSALDQIAPLAEVDPGGVTAAIEPFLASAEGQFWPQEDWQVLHQTADTILLVAKHNFIYFMSVIRDGSGWKWQGSSGGTASCELEFVFPDDVNSVMWELDRAAPPLTKESVEIAVILTERPCVGGIEIGDRLLPPEVVMTDTQVFLAFATKRPPGDFFNCQGNPPTPYRVRLPAPLGDRTLVPGNTLGIDLADYLQNTD